MSYQLTDREKEALRAADAINAILTMSTIKEGSEAAVLREKMQEARQAEARKNAQADAELQASLGVRQNMLTDQLYHRAGENRLDRESRERIAAADREAQDKLLEGIAGLTSPEQRTARGEQQTYGQLAEAVNLGQGVVDSGGNFQGAPGFAVNVMRDAGFINLADVVAGISFSDDEKAARGQFANAIGNWRKNLSGAQVTLIETILGADWDPTRTSDQNEAIRRGQRLMEFIARNRNSLGLEPIEASGGAPVGGQQPQYQDNVQKYLTD